MGVPFWRQPVVAGYVCFCGIRCHLDAHRLTSFSLALKFRRKPFTLSVVGAVAHRLETHVANCIERVSIGVVVYMCAVEQA